MCYENKRKWPWRVTAGTSVDDYIQSQLDILTSWCLWSGMKVNIKNSQLVPRCNHQCPQCLWPINLMGQTMKYVQDHKYLGCWVKEFGNYEKNTVEA